MIVARVIDGFPRVVDRLRERVALAEGLGDDHRIGADAERRALACLERFAQRLANMPAGAVRAVGTNTLRMAKNGLEFLARAEPALGHPIEIISGREEARLIYLGVAHSLEENAGRRLVVDIGGGSTECILGEGLESIETDSLYMGCVGYSLRWFPQGKVTESAMRKAEIAAALELEPIREHYRNLGWDHSSGSSGTIRAIDAILVANDWSREGIVPKGLQKIKKALLAAGNVADLPLAGLEEDRRGVLPGGLAILTAVFEAFELERMTTSTGALREGLLHDLLGRIRHEDIRNRTIRDLALAYHVDLEQAARVERTALSLLDRAMRPWDLDVETSKAFLSWASRLHEIGLSVSYTGYHKHGAYLATHSDMPGFSQEDKNLLAGLILSHRRKLPDDLFAGVSKRRQGAALRLSLLLRLAVRANRSRSTHPLPRFRFHVDGARIELDFPEGWLDAHPLTRADLEEEAAAFSGAGYELRIS